MISARDIIKKNAETFYDYSTNERLPVWRRLSFFAALSLPAGVLIYGESADFLNTVNTIVSILLGFSFSVLFFLASDFKIVPQNPHSFEQKNKKSRLEKLSKEIFYNVGYFVLISIWVLITSLVIIVPDVWGFVSRCLGMLPFEIPKAVLEIYGYATVAVSLIIRMIFAFLLIEAGYTFSRLIGRVNYLFDEKMKSGQ